MMFWWLGYLIACWLAADFLSGFWHWWEDRYANESWPLIGKWIAKPNQLHHDQPLAFLDQGYWSRNWTTIIPAAVAVALTLPNPICLVFVFVYQANEIHAWAHSKGKISTWVITLQEVGFFQSPRHHGAHHCSPFATKYCVMSNWLNPILDRMQLWRSLEWLVLKTTGIHSHTT